MQGSRALNSSYEDDGTGSPHWTSEEKASKRFKVLLKGLGPTPRLPVCVGGVVWGAGRPFPITAPRPRQERRGGVIQDDVGCLLH